MITKVLDFYESTLQNFLDVLPIMAIFVEIKFFWFPLKNDNLGLKVKSFEISRNLASYLRGVIGYDS